MDLPFDPAIPLLGIYLKEPRALIQKNINTTIFLAALFTIAKTWKQPKCATVQMDLENSMLSEISQSEKEKDHVISLICRM